MGLGQGRVPFIREECYNPGMATKNQKVSTEMLPEAGRSVMVEVPLHRPKFVKVIGHLKLELRV